MPALDPSALAAKIGAGGDAERPYVSRTLEEIRRQTARLQSTGAAPKSAVDVATQRFLTTNHINADDLDASGLKLVAGQAAATHEGTEPSRAAAPLVEKTASLRDALKASSEVDDALARARRAAAARRRTPS